MQKDLLFTDAQARSEKADLWQLFVFYSNPSREDPEARMEIDFLIAKSKVTSRHNISPIEVKSGSNYTLSSLRKFCRKYKEQTHIAYVVHKNDLKTEEEIVYLPVYMVPCL